MDRVVIDQLPVEMLRNRRVLVRIDVETERGSEAETPWIGERASRSGSEAAPEDRSPAADRSPLATLDENKLRASLPTLEYLLRHGARVIVGTHLGRGPEPPRLDEVGERLTHLLGVPVRVLEEAVGPEVIHTVMEWPEGHVVMLGNLSRYRGEERNDPEFARQLGEVAEIYCNDAFALAHRGLASTVGITQHVEVAAAGLALAREVRMLEAIIEHPSPPFLGLIAGARLETKLPILEHLLPKLDRLFIGGALSFTFLKAKGYEVGAAPVDEAFLPLVHELLDRAGGRVEIILPEDFVVVDAHAFRAFRESGGREPIPDGRVVLDKEIGSSDLPVDIGPMTLNRIGELFDGARTILWNGPLGLWEIEPFAAGTRQVAELIAERVRPRWQRSIICGDSLARAIRHFELPVERLRHLTTGGQSALQVLAGRPLPGVVALDRAMDRGEAAVGAKYAQSRTPQRILLPVDGSAHSLEVARRLGRLVNTDGAEIVLLYVRRPPAFMAEGTWDDPEAQRRRRLEHQREAERIFAAVNAALAEQGLISHGQFMVEGDPADQILRFAEEIGATLIAMGSHGRTGVLRFLMGSVSRKVLDHATCPVLIVRLPDAELVRAGLLSGS